MEDLKWQWSDLKVGDKVRFSKECESLTVGWKYSYKQGIFEVTKIEVCFYETEIRIWHRPTNTNWASYYMTVNNNNGYASGYPISHPLFDMVELAED